MQDSQVVTSAEAGLSVDFGRSLEKVLLERTVALLDLPILKRENDGLRSNFNILLSERNSLTAQVAELMRAHREQERQRLSLVTSLFGSQLTLHRAQVQLSERVASATLSRYSSWLRSPEGLPATKFANVTDSFGGLFDEVWYSLRYPDVQAGVALEHYESIGRAQARWPNPLFDPQWYVAQARAAGCDSVEVRDALKHYIEVGASWAISTHPIIPSGALSAVDNAGGATALWHLLNDRSDAVAKKIVYFDHELYLRAVPHARQSPVGSLVHYLYVGDAEGVRPHMLFDPQWYRLQCVKKGDVIAGPALEEYVRSGWKRGLEPHPLFSPSRYLSAYGDVRDGNLEPLAHYIEFGSKEKRTPHWSFDPERYSRQLAEMGLELDAGTSLEHYLGDGWQLDLQPHLGFLGEWYREQYTYPKKAGIAPLLDFVTEGWMHGRRPNPWFDAAWYLATYPGVAHDGIAAYEHFVRFGINELRQPGPAFGPGLYLEKYDDVRASGENPYRHFIDFGHAEGRSTPVPAIDAPITNVAPKPLVVRPKFSIEQLIDEVYSQVSPGCSVSHVITVPFFVAGGAELVVTNLINAITQSEPTSVVLLVLADRDDHNPADLPERCITLNLPAKVPDFAERRTLLLQMLQAIRPRIFHNVNSSDAWQVIMEHGHKIKKFTNIVGSIFAFQYNANGIRIGFAEEYLRAAIGSLTLLTTDNQRFVTDARKAYALSREDSAKIVAVYNPIADSLAQAVTGDALRSAGERPRVLWAGRLDQDKRLDLLFDLVRILPGFDFEIFGRQVVGGPPLPSGLQNAHFHGGYSNITQVLSQAPYTCFTMTTKWEGMPNVLLEVAMLGVPVVAPLVGGIGELLDESSGYPVSARPTASEYACQVQRIHDRPAEALARAAELRRRIVERHSWGAFVQRLAALNYLRQPESTEVNQTLNKIKVAGKPNGAKDFEYSQFGTGKAQ